LAGGCFSPPAKEPVVQEPEVSGPGVEEAQVKEPSAGVSAAEAKREEQLPLAADFKLPDLRLSPVTLSAYKNKQPVLLFFWTTWCPFCGRELKELNVKYKSLADRGLEILAINVGEPAYRVNSFIKNQGLSFKIVLDEDARVAGSYGIMGIPAFILVDKKGRIIFTDYYFSKREIEDLISK